MGFLPTPARWVGGGGVARRRPEPRGEGVRVPKTQRESAMAGDLPGRSSEMRPLLAVRKSVIGPPGK